MSILDSENIIRLLETPTDDRRSLMNNLKKVASTEQLILALESKPASRLTRQLLCDLLGYRGEAAAVSTLIRLLDDVEPQVRGSAAEALDKIGDPSAGSELLEQFKKEDDEGTRRAFAIALGAVGFRLAIPVLIETLKDKDPVVRGCAAWSLGVLKAQEAKEALAEALKSETGTYAKERMEEALKM